MAKIIGRGAPTSDTFGILGQEYIDELTGTRYVCTKSTHKTGTRVGEADQQCEWTPEGSGSPGSSGGGIIDVAELPTVNINENAIYRLTSSGVDMYIMTDGTYTPVKLDDIIAAVGENTNFHLQVVETLPDSLMLPDQSTMYLYIVKSTGIAYTNTGDGIFTLGSLLFEADGFDKGWSTDINSETEMGFYCVAKEITITYHACKDGVWTNLSRVANVKMTFNSLTSVAAFMAKNPTFGLIATELSGSFSLKDESTNYSIYHISSASTRKERIEDRLAAVITEFYCTQERRIIVVTIAAGITGETQTAAYINNLDGEGSKSVEFNGLDGTITCWFSTI